MSQIVTNNGLSYVGVRSTNPPQLTFQKRNPTPQDANGFKPGDQWLVNNPNLNIPISIWILAAFNNVGSEITADWAQVYPGSGAGGLVFDTPNGAAIPVGDVISFTNSDGNLVISGFAAAVNYRFSDDINVVGNIIAGTNVTATDNVSSSGGNLNFPTTTASTLTGGYITQNGVSYSHTFGTQNAFLGIRSGNPVGMTIAATDNTGSGYLSLSALTSGSFNVAVGAGCMVNATTDTFSTAIGAQSLLSAAGSTSNVAIGTNTASNLLTGSHNCIVGTGSGIDYTAAESSNIILGNAVLGTTGETNTIRIGNQGNADNQQNQCFIAGIQGVAINPANLNAVTIDVTTGQLGSQASSVLGGVNFTTTSGPTGTLSAVTLTGAGGIAITSAGSTITFTGGGGGGGAVNTLTGNTGGAVSPTGGGTIDVVGVGTVSITGNPGANTLTAAITGGTANQVLQSAGAGNAVFSTSTYPATSNQGDLIISSAANTYTNLAKDTNATRYLSNTGLGNNAAWSSVNLANGVTGVLSIANGGTGGSGGGGCGTVCGVYPSGNTGYGDQNSVALTSGTQNVAVGVGALRSCTIASNNIALGTRALLGVLSGGDNIAIGTTAGFALETGTSNTLIGQSSGAFYTGAETSNIIIGASFGTASENRTMRLGGDSSGALVGLSVTKTLIQGIRGVTTVNNNAIAVLIDSTGQLGTVSSSRRFKNNIQDMGTHSDRLHQLRPVTFNRPDFPDYIEPGLIAEEVYGIMPEMITRDKDDEIDSVRYHLLPAMLLNEVQKLRKELDQLKSQINPAPKRCTTCP